MNKLSLIPLGLLSVAISGTVAAERQPKELLFHCGCNDNGTGLEWVALNVSNKAKGHANHQEGDTEACYNTYSYEWEEYTRGWDDCEEEYGPNIYGVGDCYYVNDSGSYFRPDYYTGYMSPGDSCEEPID